MTSGKPLVAIVGRPNVGKSTLFNRLIGDRRAITSDVAGTTRDRIYADGEWQGRAFTFVDTGGLLGETRRQHRPDGLQSAVNDQVRQAIAEADTLLLLVDVQSGLTAEDRAVADVVRRSGRPILLVCNKADNPELARQCGAFFALGFGEPRPVSAQHGRGVGDLLESLVSTGGVAAQPSQPSAPALPRVALIGRPNVGKSTLFNQLAQRRQAITDKQAGTTRDVNSIMVETVSGPMELLDTAGVMRRGKSGRGIPKYSLLRTIRAINQADVVCLLLDGETGVTTQDAHITSYVLEAGKAMVLVVNKWDLVAKSPDIQEQWYRNLQDKLGFLPSPPVIFLAASTGAKTDKLALAVYDVWRIAGTRIATTDLNKVLQASLARHPGGSRHGTPKLYYATQVGVYPPTFICFVNKQTAWSETQRRYLTNTLRDHFGLLGTSIRLKFRAKQPPGIT